MSEEPSCRKFTRKMPGPKPKAHKRHFVWKFTGKCWTPIPGSTFCASVRSRNARGHFTQLSPTLGALGRMSLHLSPTCLPHLSPTLRALGRMSLHLSPALVSHTCLPHLSPLGHMSLHLSPTIVSHSGCLGPYVYTCPPHLSPTLGALVRLNLHLSPTCFPPTLGALGSMSLHLFPRLVSHTCLPLWVPWAV